MNTAAGATSIIIKNHNQQQNTSNINPTDSHIQGEKTRPAWCQSVGFLLDSPVGIRFCKLLPLSFSDAFRYFPAEIESSTVVTGIV